jgi:hypothetical protein
MKEQDQNKAACFSGEITKKGHSAEKLFVVVATGKVVP